MKGRTITFRSIFITLTIIMFANLCVNLFVNSTEPITTSKYDQDMETYLKDFQLDYQYNGDIIIYATGGEYVGTYKHGSKCDIIAMIEEYIDND